MAHSAAKGGLISESVSCWLKSPYKDAKALQCTIVLNDITAAPFPVSFPQLPAAKKDSGAAVTSLRMFVGSSAFRWIVLRIMLWILFGEI